MDRLSRRCIGLSAAVLAIVAVACRASDHSTAGKFRGPLAPYVTAASAALAQCARARTEYTPPFHHGPYFECVDSSATPPYSFEVDADSEVTAAQWEWRVDPAERHAQFQAARARLAQRYGAGFACGPDWLVWRTPDSIRVALRMKPIFATDVGRPPVDSVPWRIERLMRWGPLVDLYWCRAAAEHLGA